MVQVVRRRWRLVLALVLLGVAVSAVLTVQMTPTYRASAQLFVAIAEAPTGAAASDVDAADPNATLPSTGSAFIAERVMSYAELAPSPRVLGPVVNDLDLATSPERLSSDVAARVPPNTALIEVYADAPSPGRAADVANAVARNLGAVVQGLERRLGSGSSVVRIELTREALPPRSPLSPVPAINIMAGLVAGLALGLPAALLRESFDGRVTDEADVHEATGLATLTSVPLDRRAAEADPHDGQGRAPEEWAEAYRRLRIGVGYLSPDDPARVLLVSGASRGEGATVTALNLAASLARGGRRTVLVDADLRRPSVAGRLGLTPEVGVSTVLAGLAPAPGSLQRVRSLDVIPSGRVPPNPGELVGSRGFRDLVAGLRECYDYVVIDTPPVLAATDAAVVAAVADAVVLVCRSRQTRRSELTGAVTALADLDVRVAGVVVNGVTARSTTGDVRSP